MSQSSFRLTFICALFFLGTFTSCEAIKKQRCDRCPEFTQTENKVDVQIVEDVVYNEEK